MPLILNGSTGISGVDGSAATPALQGNDSNTGVFFGTDTVTLATGGTAAVTVDSGQRTKFPTTIAIGNATPSTSGSGITFPATDSASSDANTLDDYEEGTFSPTIIGSTLAGTATYSVQSGIYTKIGNLVFIYIRLTYSSGTGTGNLRVSGLPFTVRTTSSPNYAASITPDGITLTAANIAVATIVTATTYIAIQQIPTGGGSVTNVAYDAAGEIVLSGCYQV